jgi:phospholipid/cholesterol/gamma-HCH transport system permease protein
MEQNTVMLPMKKQENIQIKVHTEDPTHVKIEFIGQLNLQTTSAIWNQCLEIQTKYKPDILILEAKHIDYCDGTGIALFQTLKNHQERINKKCSIQKLHPRFQKLLELVTQKSEKVIHQVLTEDDTRLRTGIGYFTVNILENLYQNIVFLGMLSYQLIQISFHPKSLRFKDMWKAAEDVGPKALPIIALIGFLIGLISTFQAAPSFGEFGVQIYLIDLVSLGLIREMGPLMTAVLLAGRTASSFAAEIGTMKINQEIDALKTFGLNPIKFLVIPRVMATMIMTPILNVFLILFGLIGCALVMNILGYPPDAFLTHLYSAVTIRSCIGGLIKVFAFGMVIASVGCLHGLKTQKSARSVGYSTTQAVVSSIIMTVLVDGIFALIYYVLGI